MRMMMSATMSDVGAVEKKWAPMTRGVPRGTARVMSWCLEREARHQNDVLDETTSAAMGARLKIIFPLVRKVVEAWDKSPLVRLAECLDPSRPLAEEILALTKKLFPVLVEGAVSMSSGVEQGEFYDLSLEETELCEEVATRIVTSLAVYPG